MSGTTTRSRAGSGLDPVAPGDLAAPVERVVGKNAATKLARLDIRTARDLIGHYPYRLEPPGRLTSLAGLSVGEHVTVIARVIDHQVVQGRPGGASRLLVTIGDGTSTLALTFFARHTRALEHHARSLGPGARAMFTGDVTLFNGRRQLTHPDYEPLDERTDDAAAAARAALPTPIYRATAGMPSWKIAESVRLVLDPMVEGDLAEVLPADYRAEHRLLPALPALRAAHHPATEAQWYGALSTLRHAEALVIQTALARRRSGVRARPAIARPRVGSGLLDRFDAALPFALTAGQSEVGEEICGDLASETPMQRLLQGDVGSGKTIVALRAMLQVVDAGGQAALLAPTEVLARQHAATLGALLGPLATGGELGSDPQATRLRLLTGSTTAARRRTTLSELASGEAGLVVGTHALLTDTVQIPFLSLVVVDEQHKFGVEQRDALRTRGEAVPHQLVMTATPIPRTVAMTVYGDLEVSTLRELPAGRSPVATTIVPAANPAWVSRVWQRAREEIDAGGRVYVVAPRISSDGDTTEADDDGPAEPPEPGEVGALDLGDPGATAAPRAPRAAVLDVAERLAQVSALAGVTIGVMHGRLGGAEKDEVMAAFASGAAPLLVSTTVVEVGVDVPEASAIVILDAESFGLSQLHQLRGRVGRGPRASICLAVTNAEPESPGFERLTAFAGTNDGFVLAEADLELRREGDVLGAAQAGRSSSLRVLRLSKDADVIAAARTQARAIVEADPELEAHPGLRAAIDTALGERAEEFLPRA